jgi:endonuclease/exonuclease/phosphatase family metal-dependent hydrolase
MSRPFRVLQLNMQFGQIWDDAYPDHAPIRLEDTLAEILSHDADIVTLQEVEHANPGGAQPAVPPNYTWLKERLNGYHGYFAYPKADPRELPFGIGLAIFSRTPLRDTFKIDVPSPPVEFDFFGEKKTPTDRILIGATTTVGGRDLRVLNTHLLAFFMLKTSSENHIDQRKLVEDQLRRSTGPTILTGDFNVSKHQSLIKQFAEAGYNTVQDQEITWRRRPYVLDHIFYNRLLKPVAWKVKPTVASDHHALTADFVFAS